MANPPRNILLIQLGDIGDVVLSFPCIRALKETYPEANIVIAVREKAKELIDLAPWASGVIGVNGEKSGWYESWRHQLSFFTHLRGYRFDFAIDLRTGTRGAILAFLSGAKKRLSFYADDGKLWRNRLFTDLYKPEVISGYHVIDSMLDLLYCLDIQTEHQEPEVVIPAATRKELEALLQEQGISGEGGIIALQPFSLWSYKEWEEEKFIEVIQRLLADFEHEIVICGSQAEQERAEGMAARFPHRVFSLAGKTSLTLYAAFLQKSSLLLSVDSSGPHLAAAAGTPTVTIYGPASPMTWAPRREKHLTVQKNLLCVPCYEKGCNNSQKSRCIEELSVDEVYEPLKRMLEGA